MYTFSTIWILLSGPTIASSHGERKPGVGKGESRPPLLNTYGAPNFEAVS
ncbi:unnamed protein product, partial [Allacma fusca]